MVGLRFLVAVWMLCAPAIAADCPPDRPHKRSVTERSNTCTLLACMGRLVCPEGGGACWMVTQDCNRCNEPVTYDVCLSDADLQKASPLQIK